MRRSWPAKVSRTAVSNQCLSAELSLHGYQWRLKSANGQLISTWTWNLRNFTRRKTNFSRCPKQETPKRSAFSGALFWGSWRTLLEVLPKTWPTIPSRLNPDKAPEKVGSLKKPGWAEVRGELIIVIAGSQKKNKQQGYSTRKKGWSFQSQCRNG